MMQHPADEVTRRGFLGAGATATLGLAGLPSLLRAEDKKTDPFGGFIVGIQSYTFRNFDLEPALKRTQDLGLHYIEFSAGNRQHPHVALTSSPEQIKAVLKLCHDYGITPIAFGVQRFTKDEEVNKKVFDFGKALGLKSFSADPDPDSFDSLDKLCAEYQISIGIHPHGPQGRRLHRWYSAEVILPAVKDHHPLIGTCIDTGHLIRSAQPPFNKHLDSVQQILAMGPRNFGLHLKDHDNKADHDVIYGQGVLDVPAVLKALKDVQFKGYISIEYEHHADNPSPDVKECVAIIQQAAKKVG
jgi:sugar phosphate isomerase/epimerase